MMAALQELYLSGAGPKGNLGGQPRTVVAVTGGGGSLVGAMLSQPGASSCLLEAVVPYSKAACLAWLDRTGRSADGEPPPTALLRMLGARQTGQVSSLAAAHRAHSSLPCRTVVSPLQEGGITTGSGGA